MSAFDVGQMVTILPRWTPEGDVDDQWTGRRGRVTRTYDDGDFLVEFPDGEDVIITRRRCRMDPPA